MASIPCAAYKASSIHDNMRRQSHTRTTSTSSVDSECDSLSSSPSQTSLGGGMVMQMLRKTTGWASGDAAGRTKSQTDMSTALEVTSQKNTACDSQTYSPEPQDVTPTANATSAATSSSKQDKHVRTRKSSLPLDLFNIQGYMQPDCKPQFKRSISCPHAQPLGNRYVHTQTMLAEDILTPANIARVKRQAIKRRISESDAPDLRMLEQYDSDDDLGDFNPTMGQIVTCSY